MSFLAVKVINFFYLGIDADFLKRQLEILYEWLYANMLVR
jgi:hypothetical protein